LSRDSLVFPYVDAHVATTGRAGTYRRQTRGKKT
jgi:hypothetical protein